MRMKTRRRTDGRIVLMSVRLDHESLRSVTDERLDIALVYSWKQLNSVYRRIEMVSFSFI